MSCKEPGDDRRVAAEETRDFGTRCDALFDGKCRKLGADERERALARLRAQKRRRDGVRRAQLRCQLGQPQGARANVVVTQSKVLNVQVCAVRGPGVIAGILNDTGGRHGARSRSPNLSR